MYGKKLAYTVKIKDIKPIEGADKIELAQVMDYTVVVKKNEFKPGDIAMYIEVDSVLPDGLSPELRQKYVDIKNGVELGDATKEEIQAALAAIQEKSQYPYFEFLRDKKFKIKSMKLSKFNVISQGILFRLDTVGITEKLGTDVDLSNRFNVTEIVQDAEEAGLIQEPRNKFFKFLMRFGWFRKLKLGTKFKCEWKNEWPGKSDEENVQKIFSKMKAQYGDKEWVATEKLEGQNITIYSYTTRGWFGRKKKKIGVCSRTRSLPEKGFGAPFWTTVKRLRYDEKVKKIPGEWFCRGEHIGPGIQGNIYNLPRTDIRFFDFYQKVDGKFVKLNFDESIEFAKKWDLPFVPVLDEHYKLPETAQEMLEQSDKNTVFGNNLKHKREGFVLRLRDDYNVSFKVKNPFYTI